MTKQGKNRKLTNRLNEASSAYLVSAAHQPILWQEWGPDIFEAAKELDRPILLDIGAVWCHWCHVMDRESYENEEIAEIINANYVPVKIDRDERPDVDRRYQTFVQALGAGGGWPLTCFLTAEGKVFYGGTYFPPEDRHGRPGFKRVLSSIAHSYSSQRKEVLESADSMFEKIDEYEKSKANPGELSHRLVANIISGIETSFDAVYGGFGTAPKFPSGSALFLCMAYYESTQNHRYLDIAKVTLEKMAEGGLYDHIGGGFHRYSVDQYWYVPHFEKMTTDNAELLKAYLEMYQITREPFYKDIAEGIIDWYKRDMIDESSGGIYAHQDADITLEDDGDYFTWRKDELEKILNKDQFTLITLYFGISDQPRDLHETIDRNVMYTVKKLDIVADEMNISNENATKILCDAKKILLTERYKRQAPYIDKTLFADYNGMMLSAFAQACQTLENPHLKEFIVKSADHIIDKMYDKRHGFAHSLVNNKIRINGLLSDQIWMAKALLDVFEITLDPGYLSIAKEVMDNILNNYQDDVNGGFYDRFTAGSINSVMDIKHKPYEDIPVSSPNAMAIRVLNKLFLISGESKYNAAAEKALSGYAGSIGNYGVHFSGYGLSLFLHMNPPPQVVIIGDNSDGTTQDLIKTAKEIYRPGKEIYHIDPAKNNDQNLPEFLQEKLVAHKSRPIAFVCAGSVCAPPTSDSTELKSILSSFGKKQQ